MSGLPSRWQAELDVVLTDAPIPLDGGALAHAAQRLVSAFPALPLPGAGATLMRWQFLAALAARDLALVKIYEAHADALAILAELSPNARIDGSAPPLSHACDLGGVGCTLATYRRALRLARRVADQAGRHEGVVLGRALRHPRTRYLCR